MSEVASPRIQEAAPTPSETPGGTRFRPDIEGLRAVAIALVVLYHAGVPLVRGGFIGVDIFFVISGFLITSLLVRSAEQSGRVSLRQFYARRAKRLLPASALVLLVVAALTVIIMPASDQRTFGADISASAAYIVNWRFAASAVDYLAQGSTESPVLHFWSLAVEEQFYLVWPFLIILAVALARRLRWNLKRAMAGALLVVAIPSFVASVVLTGTSQASAFFLTATRLWELAVGALVAIGAARLARLPRAVAVSLAWAGALAIAFGTFMFTTATAWPGGLALVPVLGTAAVIAAGMGGTRSVIGRILGWRPMVWVGGLSYSLYLWHWPVLIFGEEFFGELTGKQSLALAVASVVPAYLSLRFVENPVRYSRRLAKGASLALAIGAALTLAGIAAGFAVMAATPRQADVPQVDLVLSEPTPSALPTLAVLGAQVLGQDPTHSSAGYPKDEYELIVPAPEAAAEDVPSSYAERCQANSVTIKVRVCSTGDLKSSLVIAALGDSKMMQYFDAFDIVGKELGVRFEFRAKSACPSTDGYPTNEGDPYDSCVTFNETVFASLEEDPPAAVIVGGGVAPDVDETNPDAEKDGLVARWQRFEGLGSTVIVMIEPPRPPGPDDVFVCMQKNPSNATECAYDKARAVARSMAPVERSALEEVPDAVAIDVTDFVCPHTNCAPVIGNVLVQRKRSHLTNTYAISLVPELLRQLTPVVDDLRS